MAFLRQTPQLYNQIGRRFTIATGSTPSPTAVMARVAALRVEDWPQPVNSTRRLVGRSPFSVEDGVPRVELGLLARRESAPRVRRMSIVLDARAQDNECGR